MALSRRCLLAGGCAAAGLAATGCFHGRSGKLAVIPKTTAIDYWENLHAGAQTAAAQIRLQIFWNAPQSETSFAQQALMAEEMIRERVDGIVLAPSHGSVLASAVRHAKADNIPLVLVDSPVSAGPDEYVAYIGSDHERIGRLAAERMGEILDGKGDIAIIGVSPTVETSVQRERAFSSAIASGFRNIRVAELRYGLSDHIRSRELAADILATRPNVRALFASDPFSTRGSLIALRNSPSRKVHLVGVAQETDLLGYVEQGVIDTLVVQDPYSMGLRAVEILGHTLNGGYHGPQRIETRVALASRNNLNSAEVQSLVARRTTV